VYLYAQAKILILAVEINAVDHFLNGADSG